MELFVFKNYSPFMQNITCQCLNDYTTYKFKILTRDRPGHTAPTPVIVILRNCKCYGRVKVFYRIPKTGVAFVHFRRAL